MDNWGNTQDMVDKIVEDVERIEIRITKQGLREVASQLTLAQQRLEALGRPTEIGNRSHLQRLQRRLPYQLRCWWVQEVVFKLEDAGLEPTLQDFVTFLERSSEGVQPEDQQWFEGGSPVTKQYNAYPRPSNNDFQT